MREEEYFDNIDDIIEDNLNKNLMRVMFLNKRKKNLDLDDISSLHKEFLIQNEMIKKINKMFKNKEDYRIQEEEIEYFNEKEEEYDVEVKEVASLLKEF